MSYLKKVISGYHISYLWRKENFRSVERFNDYTYKLSFFEFSMLSSGHIFLPIGIFLCFATTFSSQGIFLFCVVFPLLCGTIVSKKLKSKFSIDWFMEEIVRPVDEMSADQRKKLLVNVSLWYLLNIGLFFFELIVLSVVYHKVRY